MPARAMIRLHSAFGERVVCGKTGMILEFEAPRSDWGQPGISLGD